MRIKTVILIQERKSGYFIDWNGRTENNPKYKYPTTFPDIRKAEIFMEQMLDGSSEEKKKKYSLVRMKSKEYFNKFFDDVLINDFKDLKKLT